MIDYHIHIERGPYNLEWLKRFWFQAESRGITEIGVTEHTHHFYEFRTVYEHLLQTTEPDADTSSWLGDYFQHSIEEYLELLEAGKKAGIPLKAGLEADCVPGKEREIEALLDEYRFDFVLGSVHFLDSWSFDIKPTMGWPGKDVDKVYLAYIDRVKSMAQSGLFDVLAHLDVIKVFGHKAQADLGGEWTEVLQLIVQSDLVIEVSTAGMRKLVGEIYPHPSLIKGAARLGIPITFASDAHNPEDVGDRWKEAVNVARSLGHSRYCTFTERRRTEHPLPSFDSTAL